MKRGERKALSQVSWRLTGPLYSVLTSHEVADGWHKNMRTVHAACRDGRLVARKTRGQWLISQRSVINLWGKPLEGAYHENIYD